MATTAEPTLDGATAAWCAAAEAALTEPPADGCACLDLARRGVLLRREWDCADPGSPLRRRLVALLPAIENLAQCRLTESIGAAPCAAVLAVRLTAHLADDEAYLAALLNDHRLPPANLALAIEAFRDDLDWLATLAAVLDGSRGIDFLDRIFLEEETLARRFDAWADQAGVGRSTPRADQTIVDDLRPAARRLRETALARQVEALATQRTPDTSRAWYERWQAASRLLTRLEPRLPLANLQDPHSRVSSQREQAIDGWRRALAGLDEDTRLATLTRTAEDLQDGVNESLTFVEDMALPDAVRTLNVLEQDVAACRRTVAEDPAAAARPLRKALRRRAQHLAGELQDREIGLRMERLLGRTFVAALEKLILVLLVFFIGILLAEGPLLRYEAHRLGYAETPHGLSRIEPILGWLDLGICAVFLFEFGLKFALARRKLLYLRRNWLTGLVPALPVGFLFYVTHHFVLADDAQWIVAIRLLRYVRLPQMARWLRVARPVVRLARLVGFLVRASDRLVRQMAPLLNRNLILFHRAAVLVEEPAYRLRLASLRERFSYRAEAALGELPVAHRVAAARQRIEDLEAMLSTAPSSALVALPGDVAPPEREIPLEVLIARLLSATPAEVSDRIGANLAASVARWCRALDVLAVRRLPLVREMVSAARLPSPYETTARVANRLGQFCSDWLDRFYWFADLYGTVTAPQLVDSLGDYLVRTSERPARKLVLAGLAFLFVSFLLEPMLLVPGWLSQGVQRLIGTPLIVLGLLCMIPLLVGQWFRRIAGEASDFYGKVAEAQFLTATKHVKRRLAAGHRALVNRRVLDREAAWLAPDGNPHTALCAARDAVDLLWNDYLDGAPFHQSDTRTTNQLLGNLALVSLRATRLKRDRRRQTALKRLDLTASRAPLRGPYLWFRFISRSLAHQTAKLVINYNAYALPLDRAATASDEEICRHVEWLSRRWQRPPAELPLPPEFRRRFDLLFDGIVESGPGPLRGFQGNEFTAVHFLSADPQLKSEVRRRYGDAVADLMHRDRVDNIRRVFRTYPFHDWPEERRTFNPLVFYGRHLAGGWILLLPLKLAWWALRAAFRAVGLLVEFVRDVLHPKIGEVDAAPDSDPFEVAVRKIHRMRKPLVLECLRLRAEFDPEYLGCLVPGAPPASPTTLHVEIEDDLAAIAAPSAIREEFRALADVRRQQILAIRRWLDRFGLCELSGESLRAVTIAYTVDYRGLRTTLDAVTAIEQALSVSGDSRGARRAARLRPSRLIFAWRYRRRFERLFELPRMSGVEDDQRAALVDAAYHRPDLRAAVKQLTAAGGADRFQRARRILTEVGRDPATWSRQLLVLRTVETLSVIDLKIYQDLVAELGEYETTAAREEETA